MQKRSLSIVLANMLDHFDSNLYGFMVPIIAPLFFPQQKPIVQLILAYSFLATSSITRPIGVLIFGWLVMRRDPLKILRITLIGVGVSSFMMGCIPTASSAGYCSAIILLCVRIVGGIFAEGEKTIASLYILEGHTQNKAIMINAWLGSSVIGGCAMASWAASTVSGDTWRIPFWCGGVLALYAVFLRCHNMRHPRKPQNGLSKMITTASDTQISFRSILTVIFTGGLYYVTYDISFVLMNTFVPCITNITRETMMYWNTTLLLFDMFLFIPVAYLIRNRDMIAVKRVSVLMLALPAIPLFYYMQNASLTYVLLVRFWIVIWGVVFACVLNVHLLDLFPNKHKYMWIGLGSATGIALIGRSTSALCLWGWHKTHLAATPGIYLCIIALVVWVLSHRVNFFGVLER